MLFEIRFEDHLWVLYTKNWGGDEWYMVKSFTDIEQALKYERKLKKY